MHIVHFDVYGGMGGRGVRGLVSQSEPNGSGRELSEAKRARWTHNTRQANIYTQDRLTFAHKTCSNGHITHEKLTANKCTIWD